MNRNTVFVAQGIDELETIAEFFALKLQQSTGYELAVVNDTAETNFIALALDPALEINEEGYALESNDKGVSISAKTPQGAYYGLQTLMQLLPAEIESQNVVNHVSWSIPAVDILDEPAFSWRGFHLDVCRHFISLEQVKKHIDMLSIFKINKFHWQPDRRSGMEN